MDSPARVGARMKRLRGRAGLSLSHLANELGISKSYLSRMENGKMFYKHHLAEQAKDILT